MCATWKKKKKRRDARLLLHLCSHHTHVYNIKCASSAHSLQSRKEREMHRKLLRCSSGIYDSSSFTLSELRYRRDVCVCVWVCKYMIASARWHVGDYWPRESVAIFLFFFSITKNWVFFIPLWRNGRQMHISYFFDWNFSVISKILFSDEIV